MFQIDVQMRRNVRNYFSSLVVLLPRPEGEGVRQDCVALRVASLKKAKKKPRIDRGFFNKAATV